MINPDSMLWQRVNEYPVSNPSNNPTIQLTPQNRPPILDTRPDLNIYWIPKSLEERTDKPDAEGNIYNCFRPLALDFTFTLLDRLSDFRGSEVSLSGLGRGNIEPFLELPFLYPSSKYQQNFRAKSIIGVEGERLGVIIYDLPQNIKPTLPRDKLASLINAGKISLLIFPEIYDPERKQEGWRRLLDNLSNSPLSKDFTGPFSPNY